MQIYPAIDLQNNSCVRLYQGQFDQCTTYTATPLTVAQNYADQGATWLHMVDLDAAKQNGHDHLLIVQQIQQQTQLNIQFGGGIRSANTINALLTAGIKRVIIGSLAIKQPELVKTWLKEFGSEHLVIAVDVFCRDDQEPMLATHGWQQQSQTNLWQLLTDYADTELKHILCTDISRDGTLQGPSFELYQRCQQQFPQYALQASGGISQLQDLQRLRQQQLAGAIIGKALYENRINLSQALTEEILC